MTHNKIKKIKYNNIFLTAVAFKAVFCIYFA